MAINMKSLTQALAKTAAAIEKTVQTTVQEVTGPKALQDYDLLEQVASGGPALAWKLFSARPRNKNSLSQYSQVCVWYLDKKTLSDARQKAGLSKSAEDAFLDILRADAARLVRLRHPGVVHVVQGLDESKVAMALVTEPIFSSLANAMGDLSNISEVPKDLKAIDMSELEIKHGLLQLSESLAFLHNNARLVHRAISPETVFITATGAWKLGCFGFAISANQATDAETIQPFHYPEYDVEDSVVPLQPSLNYTAPELVRSNPSSISYACDIFSLGCLIYHLLTKRPLLDCHNNARMFMSKVQYLSHENFSDISPDLIPNLREMLSPNETSRPSALDFTGSSYFRDDTRLRALRFLDHMLEIDNMKKSEFLKALAGMWKDFDARVLRYKVLPPLCAELRNVVIQQMILPMVLTIAESQDKNDFEISTLPALVPVFSSATGDTLLLLVKHAELIINKADQEQLVAHILPLLVRAYDDPDVRIQEEVLKRTVALAKQLDFQVMKQSVLPRVHGLALKTTVAAVRVNALMCLGELVHWLDKRAVLDILQTLQRCTAVDHSAPTLMSTLGVAQAIYKQYGLEFAVEHLLPLLAPLLVAQQLNLQQFAKYMLFVKEILRKVEEKRGVTLSEMGSSRDISSNIIGVNSSYMESMKSVSFAGNKHSNSWDSEDWGKLAKSSNSSASLNHSSPDAKFSLKSALKDSLKTVSVQPDTASKNESWYLDDWVSTAKDSKSVAGVSHSSLDGRVAFNNMMKEPQNSSMQMMEHSVGPNLLTSQASISITCAPADTLWPTPSTVTSVLSTSESTASFSEYGSWSTSTDGGLPGTGKMKSKLNNPTASVGSMSSIDVIDPFADWPPRANANSAVNQTRQIPSSGHVVRAENTPIQNASSVDMASNLGLQFSQSAAPENHNPIDIGTIFPSTKTDPVPLKIAPPPSGGSKGIGRGRGRARTSVQARSNSSNEGNSKTHGSQPPLLDLL